MVKAWLFDLVPYPQADPPAVEPRRAAALLEEHLQTWTEAEAQGYTGVFLGEHHFTPYSLSPSPNLLVAALAQRTSTLRIGIMCNILPMHDPRRLAEEGAMLDLLSDGRLEFGLGRGADEHEFDKIGMPMETHPPARGHRADRPRVDAGHVQLRRRLLQDRRVDARPPAAPAAAPADLGHRHRRAPRPCHGRPRRATRSPPSSSPPSSCATSRLGPHGWAAAAARQSGPDNIGLARQMYVAESEQQALEECAAAFEYFILQFRNVALFDDPDNLPGGYESTSSSSARSTPTSRPSSAPSSTPASSGAAPRSRCASRSSTRSAPQGAATSCSRARSAT